MKVAVGQIGWAGVDECGSMTAAVVAAAGVAAAGVVGPRVRRDGVQSSD